MSIMKSATIWMFDLYEGWFNEEIMLASNHNEIDSVVHRKMRRRLLSEMPRRIMEIWIKQKATTEEANEAY